MTTEDKAPAPAHNFKRQYNVLLIGDSITQYAEHTNTQGYCTLLRNHFGQSASFYNLGIPSGPTSQLTDIVLHSDFKKLIPSNIDKVFIGLGANDSNWGTDPVKWPSIDEMKRNYLKMIEKLKQDLTSDIVIISPPECNYTDAGHKKLCDTMAIYSLELKKFAAEMGMPFLDIREKRKPGEVYQSDGLHLNALGNQYVFELMRDVMPTNLPRWSVYFSDRPYHWCDDRDFTQNKEENIETGECQCRLNFRKVVDATDPKKFSCVQCPDLLERSADHISCQCMQWNQQFNIQQNKCECVPNTILKDGKCVPVSCSHQQPMLADSMRISAQKGANLSPVFIIALLVISVFVSLILTVATAIVLKKNKKQAQLIKQLSQSNGCMIE